MLIVNWIHWLVVVELLFVSTSE